MRTAPGADRRPTEFTVRFHARLTGAAVVPPGDDPAPPAPPAPAPAAPPPPPTPVLVEPDPRPPEPDVDGERVEAALSQVRDAVGEYRKDQAGRLRDWQRAAVELALTIATRLLHERVASGEFPIEAKVRDMVAQLGEDAALTVRLNPADLAALTSRLAGGSLDDGRDDPKFVPDDSLGRGECRVEGREAMLLSDVSRELQEIRDELLRSIAHARP
ncbi:MAG: hypothetical protein C0501_16675 [Isosphaera sp.]|nr:hypothetical protein [Isosphaera sp.]